MLYICEYTHRIYSCKYLERNGHQRQNQNDHEKYNHISLDWLLTGKGNMTDEEQNIDSPELDYPLFASENPKNPAINTNALENRKEMALEKPSNTTKEIVKQEIIYKERPPRKITEIRIFFDDNIYFRPNSN